MPTFVYKCLNCGHEWEEFRWIHEDFPECPNCKIKNTKEDTVIIKQPTAPIGLHGLPTPKFH